MTLIKFQSSNFITMSPNGQRGAFTVLANQSNIQNGMFANISGILGSWAFFCCYPGTSPNSSELFYLLAFLNLFEVFLSGGFYWICRRGGLRGKPIELLQNWYRFFDPSALRVYLHVKWFENWRYRRCYFEMRTQKNWPVLANTLVKESN